MNAVELFISLVTIPSPLRKVGHIQEWLKIFFSLNFPEADQFLDQAGKNLSGFQAGNLLIKIPASPGYESLSTLGVEAHVDTVQETERIIPISDGKIIRSSGNTILGADDKAGVAAIITALMNLKKRNHGPIEVLFSVGEESSMYGLRQFDFSKLTASKFLCVDGFSPTELITACAGKIKYRTTFHGKSSHGAEPEKAINAITMATLAISRCVESGLTGRLENGVIHNIAEIQSHEGPSNYPNNNTIPGECVIAGELRGLNKKDLNKTYEEVCDSFRYAAEKLGGHVEVEQLIPYEPFSVSHSSMIIKILESRNPEKSFSYSSCDGSTHSNIFNSKGIQSVVIGAGCRNPHTKEELCIISELLEAVEIIENYLSA